MILSVNNFRAFQIWASIKIGASLNNGNISQQDIIATIQAFDGTREDIERVVMIETIKRNLK